MITDLTWEMVVIGAVRVLGSLPVLRWAFAGALIAIIADLSDLFLMNLLDLGGLGDYQRFDKYVDQVYMLGFLMVSRRWQDVPRRIAIVLYAYRLIGFVAFEFTGWRYLLPLFPNLFEFWFVFVAAVTHWRPGYAFTRRQIVGWGGLLLALKEFQEYALHGGRWLDGFTAVEAVQAIWRWITAPLQ